MQSTRACLPACAASSRLRRVVQVVDLFLGVAVAFLHFAFDLIFQALDLLLFAAGELAGLFLDFAANVLGGAFHLVFIHRMSPL